MGASRDRMIMVMVINGRRRSGRSRDGMRHARRARMDRVVIVDVHDGREIHVEEGRKYGIIQG